MFDVLFKHLSKILFKRPKVIRPKNIMLANISPKI